MFQKKGTKSDCEETLVKHEEVANSVKKILLICKTSYEIEPDQVEKTIICIESGAKQRKTNKLEDTNSMKHQSLKS
jgi:hypothetical protein